MSAAVSFLEVLWAGFALVGFGLVCAGVVLVGFALWEFERFVADVRREVRRAGGSVFSRGV